MRKSLVRCISNSIDTALQKALKPGSDNIECQPENKSHSCNKSWDSGVFSGKKSVDPAAANVLTALGRFFHSLMAEPKYEGKTHICNGGTSVKSTLFFEL